MIPTDSDKLFPNVLDRDAALNALIAVIDDYNSDLADEVRALADFKDPVKINSNFLNDLGAYLNAGLLATDSERIKRNKIVNAIAGHKIRGSFNLDAKPKIDAIAGGDSEIFRLTDEQLWLLVGDGTTPSAVNWSVLGGLSSSDGWGFALYGAGTELGIPGNIYIDVDNAALTAGEIEQIVLSLADVVPDYFKVYIGYVNVSNVFVLYETIG